MLQYLSILQFYYIIFFHYILVLQNTITIMFESRFDLLSFQILFSIASHQIDIQISERNSRNRISTSQNIPKQNYNIENLNPTMDFNFQPEHEHAQHQITLQLKKKKKKRKHVPPNAIRTFAHTTLLPSS